MIDTAKHTRQPSFLDEVIEGTPGGRAHRPLPAMRQLRRVVSQRRRHAVHSPHALRHDQRQPADRGALVEHDVVLRLLLLLHHALPAEHPHHGPDVLPEAAGDPRRPGQGHRRPGAGQDVHGAVGPLRPQFRARPGQPFLPLQQAAGAAADGPAGVVHVYPRPHVADPQEDQEHRAVAGHHQERHASWEEPREVRLLSRMFAGSQHRGLRHVGPRSGRHAADRTGGDRRLELLRGHGVFLAGRIDRLRGDCPEPGPGRSASSTR